MEIVDDFEIALRELIKDVDKNIKINIIYSGKLKPYGAYAIYNKNLNVVEFKLNKLWREISSDIKLGLLQELIFKLFRINKRTINMDLYNNFIRNLHKVIPKTQIDPTLKESFDRVNQKYFFGMMEMPNLKFGNHSTTSLGHYDFKTDTITISRIFENNNELLDYLMYHELLHKKLKYRNTGMRNRYHSKIFRDEEKRFENFKEIQKKIRNLVATKKRRNLSLFSKIFS